MSYYECVGITKTPKSKLLHLIGGESTNSRTIGREVVSVFTQEEYSIGDIVQTMMIKDSNGSWRHIIIPKEGGTKLNG